MATDLPTRLASRLSLPPHEEDFSTALSSAFAGGSGGFDSGFDSGFDAGSRAEDTIPFGWLIRPDTLPLPISTGAGFVWGDSLFPLPEPAAVSGELAGTVAGVATVTADLTVEAAGANELAGTVAGIAAVTGTLTQIHELAGTVGGQAAVTAELTTVLLEGNIDGQATVTGTLSVTIELSGTVGGQTTVTGSLFQQHNLSGTVGGVAAVIGRLQPRLLKIPSLIPTDLSNLPINELSGFINGAATVSGGIIAPLYGVVQGIPFQLGFGGKGTDVLVGSETTGRASVTGTLTTIKQLAGTIAGRFIETLFPVVPEPFAKSDVIVTASNNNAEAGYALDDNPGTQWATYTGQYVGMYLRFQLPTATILSSLTINTNSTTDYAYNFNIRGSNNGSSWTILGSYVGVGTGTYTWDIPAPNTGAYLYYDIILTSASGYWWRVNEVDFGFDTFARLSISGAPAMTADPIAGSTTVTGLLDNGALDGDGDIIIELAGNIDGVCTVFVDWPWLTAPRRRPFNVDFLYTSVLVGAGFDPTDTYAGADSQTYPDGHVRSFDRFLYLLKSIGPGFDPIDDVSTHPDFVSQTFPDGHLRDDFDRFLYLYLNVIKQVDRPFNKMVILPGWTPKTPSHAVPPKGVNQ